jgi:hypothetical protein
MMKASDMKITVHYIVEEWHWTWMDGEWVRYVDKARLESIGVKE